MNKAELIKAVADSADISSADASRAVDGVFDTIAATLQKRLRGQAGGVRLLQRRRPEGHERAQPAHRRSHLDPRLEAAEVQGRQEPQGRGQRLSAIDAVLRRARGAGRPSSLGRRWRPHGARAARARAVSSVGRALGLHPRGRRFEPVTAHHASAIAPEARGRPSGLTPPNPCSTWGAAGRGAGTPPGRRGCSSAWFRAPACHAGGRGFESRHSRHILRRADCRRRDAKGCNGVPVLMQASGFGGGRRALRRECRSYGGGAPPRAPGRCGGCGR